MTTTQHRSAAELRQEHAEEHASLTLLRQEHEAAIDAPEWNPKAHASRASKIAAAADRVAHLAAAIERADAREAEAALEARRVALKDEAHAILAGYIAVIDREMAQEHVAREAYLRAATGVRVALAPIAERFRKVIEAVMQDRTRSADTLALVLPTVRGHDADQAHAESTFYRAASQALGLDHAYRTQEELESLATSTSSLADAAKRNLRALRSALGNVDPELRLPSKAPVAAPAETFIPVGGRLVPVTGRTTITSETIAGQRQREHAAERARAGLSNDDGAPYDGSEE